MKGVHQARGLLLLGILLGVEGCVSTYKTPPIPFPRRPQVQVDVSGGRVLDWGDLDLAQPAAPASPGRDGTGKKADSPAGPQGRAGKGGKGSPPSAGKPKAGPPRKKQAPSPAPPPPPAPAGPPGPGAEPLTLKFGSNIIVDKKTGLITKIYSVPIGMGETIHAMAASKPPKGGPPNLIRRMMGDHPLLVELCKKPLDFFYGGNLKYGQKGSPAPLTETLVVTSDADGLEAFERALNLLFNSVPQVDITVRVVETSFTETLDIGVRQSGSTPMIRRLKNPGSMFFQGFSGNFPNKSGLGKSSVLSSEGLFTLGGIHDNWELNAILEVLQTQLHSDIVSQPRIAVRNGGVAQISTYSEIPYPNARISGNTIITTNIVFKRVGITMSIRPTISGTDTIMLQLDLTVDAITGYEDTDPIRTPVISKRTAQTDVYVRDGQTVSLGGLVLKNQAETERKVPILGDIPLLGLLFRSTYKETRKSELIFFITPRIMRRGNAEDFEQLIPMGGLESSL